MISKLPQMDAILKLANSWPERLVDFYLTTGGLRGNHYFTKYTTKVHYAMIIYTLIFVCQELCGAITHLKSDQFTLEQVILPLPFAVLASCNFIAIYTVVYRRPILAKCVRDATKKLNSWNEVEEVPAWRKHKLVFRCFLFIYGVSPWFSGTNLIVVSPFVRFVWKIGTCSYVVFPNWYPFDVLSSGWFWAAYFYEAVLLFYSIYIFSIFKISLLYSLTLTSVRFDTLGMFFVKVTGSPERGVWNSLEGGRIGFKSPETDTGIQGISMPQFLPVKKNQAASCTSSGRLKLGMEDYCVLRRQKKLIDQTFKVYFNLCNVVSCATNFTLAYALANHFRSADTTIVKAVSGSYVYFAFLLASLSDVYFICYNVVSLQKAHDDMRISMWHSDWIEENNEFKKLFYFSKTPMNRSLKTRAFGFYPLDLVAFRDNLSASWSYFLFLYQLAPSTR